MNKEEILNTFLLANIPEIITQEEFDDVKKAVFEMLKENQKLKVDYGTKIQVERDLLKEENQKYKEVIDKAINDLDIIIDIVKEQPLGDCWIINRLEVNKSILKEVE